MRTFKDIKIGDIIVAYDDYCLDYIEHLIKIDDIEYYKEYVTETNPSGLICCGTDIEEADYKTLVHEGNFVSFAEDKERLEI